MLKVNPLKDQQVKSMFTCCILIHNISAAIDYCAVTRTLARTAQNTQAHTVLSDTGSNSGSIREPVHSSICEAQGVQHSLVLHSPVTCAHVF